MAHKVFIPVTDEMLYDYPELITAPLQPYQIDKPCFHWMATIESSDDTEKAKGKVKHFSHRMPLGKSTIQTRSRLA